MYNFFPGDDVMLNLSNVTFPLSVIKPWTDRCKSHDIYAFVIAFLFIYKVQYTLLRQPNSTAPVPGAVHCRHFQSYPHNNGNTHTCVFWPTCLSARCLWTFTTSKRHHRLPGRFQKDHNNAKPLYWMMIGLSLQLFQLLELPVYGPHLLQPLLCFIIPHWHRFAKLN